MRWLRHSLQNQRKRQADRRSFKFTNLNCNPAAFECIIGRATNFLAIRSSYGEPPDVPSGILGREGPGRASTTARQQWTRTQQKTRASRSDARREFLLGQANAGTYANGRSAG